MDVTLYVGNLSYDTSEADLNTLFSGSGTVMSVALIKDRDTGRSKGFAFIEMSSQTEAEQAVKDINGSLIDNRPIKVNLARPAKQNDYSSYNKRSNKRSNKNRNQNKGRNGSYRY